MVHSINTQVQDAREASQNANPCAITLFSIVWIYIKKYIFHFNFVHYQNNAF